MYVAYGFIRDYNAGADTCSVEINGLGIIDTWIDGLKISNAVNRAALADGVPCVITMPDAHRICEAMVSSVQGANYQPAGTAFTTQGRTSLSTDNTGHGSVSVSYGHTYSTVPTVSATPDYGTIALSAITTTGFTATLTGGIILATTFFNWQATGS